MEDAKRQELIAFLTTFDGRVSLRDYWLRFTVFYIAFVFGTGLIDAILGIHLFYPIFVLAALWPSICVGIKRCHDRDRSGLFMLLCFVPFLNIWLLVEMIFLGGTVGPNRFGPDPRD